MPNPHYHIQKKTPERQYQGKNTSLKMSTFYQRYFVVSMKNSVVA